MRHSKPREIKMPNIKEFDEKGRTSNYSFYSRNLKEPRSSATEHRDAF